MQTAALVVGAVVLVVLALRAVAYVFGHHTSETLDFRGPVRGVDVAVGTGEITVRGSGRTDARVRRIMRRGLRRPRISEVVEDGVLRLRVSSGVVHYEIDVPAEAAVQVHGQATTATLIGVGGRVDLRASEGSLEGRALAAPAVHAVTAAGSIRLSFDRLPELVDVRTGKGSVELVLPEGETDVRATAPGPVRILHR